MHHGVAMVLSYQAQIDQKIYPVSLNFEPHRGKQSDSYDGVFLYFGESYILLFANFHFRNENGSDVWTFQKT